MKFLCTIIAHPIPFTLDNSLDYFLLNSVQQCVKSSSSVNCVAYITCSALTPYFTCNPSSIYLEKERIQLRKRQGTI